MKNLFKAFAVLTCGAFLTASLTSCHSSREEINETTGNTMVAASNTLKVKFSSPLPAGATITYGSFTYTAVGGETEVTIDPAAAKGKLVLGGTLISQSLNVDFGDRSTLAVELDVAENAPASAQVSAATVQGGATVNNDGDNQTKTGGVAASFQLVSSDGSSVTPTNAIGLTNPYSLVVFTPAYIPVAKVEKKSYNDYAPYAVACEPDKATFDKPAKLSVLVEGASEIGDAGFQYKNGSDEPTTTLNGNYVETYVTHFSNWNVILKATCIDITEGSETLATGSLTAGENTISYKENFGFNSDEKGVLAKWLKCLFGATATKVDKKGTITAKSNGTYTIYQKTYVYTFTAGKKTFKATVYGKAEYDATYTGGEENKPASETPSHSGGTGNQPK